VTVVKARGTLSKYRKSVVNISARKKSPPTSNGDSDCSWAVETCFETPEDDFGAISILCIMNRLSRNSARLNYVAKGIVGV